MRMTPPNSAPSGDSSLSVQDTRETCLFLFRTHGRLVSPSSAHSGDWSLSVQDTRETGLSRLVWHALFPNLPLLIKIRRKGRYAGTRSSMWNARQSNLWYRCGNFVPFPVHKLLVPCQNVLITLSSSFYLRKIIVAVIEPSLIRYGIWRFRGDEDWSFRAMTPCSLVGKYHRLEGIYCYRVQLNEAEWCSDTGLTELSISDSTECACVCLLESPSLNVGQETQVVGRTWSVWKSVLWASVT
jgi:hypothetical protein